MATQCSDNRPRFAWCQFSLKWLLIAIAAFAIWLGWNAHRVRQREVVLQFVKSRGATIYLGRSDTPWKRLPVTWRLFGAESVKFMFIHGNVVDGADREHITSLFPEAEIDFSTR
jgi:hypothetical protein